MNPKNYIGKIILIDKKYGNSDLNHILEIKEVEPSKEGLLQIKTNNPRITIDEITENQLEKRILSQSSKDPSIYLNNEGIKFKMYLDGGVEMVL